MVELVAKCHFLVGLQYFSSIFHFIIRYYLWVGKKIDKK